MRELLRLKTIITSSLLVAHNGLRYLLADGRGFGLRAGFRMGVGKSPKMRQNPASQVHALLARS